VKYHWSGKNRTVKSAEEEAALGGGWASSPAAFAPYQGPRTTNRDQDPERWVDSWDVLGLSPESKKTIKAHLSRVDSEFWKSPDAPSADATAMKSAFDKIAEVLSRAGLLNQALLDDQIPALVWDSAIAAGWWRLASETPNEVFCERLGHYWVWREEGKDWQGLFRSEVRKWRAHLLESGTVVANPPGGPAITEGNDSEITNDNDAGLGELPINRAVEITRIPVHEPPTAAFQNRAVWIKKELRMRAWSEYDLRDEGGPDHKTTQQKIFRGLPVGDRVLDKIVDALNKKLVDQEGRPLRRISRQDIPID